MNEYSELISKYSEKDFSYPLNTDLPGFFDLKKIQKEIFPNPQIFNLERLIGDLVSYSYIPNEEDPRFNDMIAKFELLFEKYSTDGTLVFHYETVLIYCQMK